MTQKVDDKALSEKQVSFCPSKQICHEEKWWGRQRRQQKIRVLLLQIFDLQRIHEGVLRVKKFHHSPGCQGQATRERNENSK